MNPPLLRITSCMADNAEIDASVVDSTVLEVGLAHAPWLKNEIRVIGTLGPSPMPPWVMLKSLVPELRAGLRDTLLAIHADAAGARILGQWGISHFTAVDDAAYDPIRAMANEAHGIALTHEYHSR